MNVWSSRRVSDGVDGKTPRAQHPRRRVFASTAPTFSRPHRSRLMRCLVTCLSPSSTYTHTMNTIEASLNAALTELITSANTCASVIIVGVPVPNIVRIVVPVLVLDVDRFVVNPFRIIDQRIDDDRDRGRHDGGSTPRMYRSQVESASSDDVKRRCFTISFSEKREWHVVSPTISLSVSQTSATNREKCSSGAARRGAAPLTFEEPRTKLVLLALGFSLRKGRNCHSQGSVSSPTRK